MFYSAKQASFSEKVSLGEYYFSLRNSTTLSKELPDSFGLNLSDTRPSVQFGKISLCPQRVFELMLALWRCCSSTSNILSNLRAVTTDKETGELKLVSGLYSRSVQLWGEWHMVATLLSWYLMLPPLCITPVPPLFYNLFFFYNLFLFKIGIK